MTFSKIRAIFTSKKKACLASGAVAGLLTLSFVPSVGASGYGGYGGSENDFNARSSENYSEYHDASTTVAATASYKSHSSCEYSQYRYDAYSGKWKHMAYNAGTGVWYSCEQSEAYDASYYFNQSRKDTKSYNSYNDFAAHNRAY